jgi:hypothetical protein
MTTNFETLYIHYSCVILPFHAKCFNYRQSRKITHKKVGVKTYDNWEYGISFIACRAKQEGGDEEADDEIGRNERGP